MKIRKLSSIKNLYHNKLDKDNPLKIFIIYSIQTSCIFRLQN